MSEQVKIKELKKKEIRSLLLPHKMGLTLNELEKQFKDVIGHDIPYRQMGYNTLKDFICDIPDVVTWRLVHGKLILTGVPDASTQHIANLVSRQKNPKVKKGQRSTFIKTRFVPVAPRFSREFSRQPAVQSNLRSAQDVDRPDSNGSL